MNNIQISQDGIISLNIQIEASNSEREEYELFIYTSKDDFQQPLDLDLGTFKTNTSYPIEFDGLRKIGEFEGSLQLKLKAEATRFPVMIENISKEKLKLGKEFTINWSDHNESGWYNVELYQNGDFVAKLIGHHRGLSLEGEIPKDLDKGEYAIRVTPTNDETLHSDDFPVVLRKGTSMALILAPLVAVGGGVVLLAGGESGGGSSSGLPNPPDPPNN